MLSHRLRHRLAACTVLALGGVGVGCGASTTDSDAAADASLDATPSDGGEDAARDASGDRSPLGDGRAPIVHRADDSQCREPAALGNCVCAGVCPDPPFACTTDGQCADAGPAGRCVSPGGPAGCGCTFDACAGDDDCASGETCACHGSAYTYAMGNHCVPGNCRVDADCGPGGACSPSPASKCGDAGSLCLGYYCHTTDDLCLDDDDCDGVANTCVYSATTSRWECQFYAPPL